MLFEDESNSREADSKKPQGDEGRIMFVPQEAIISYHHQPERYQHPPALFYEQRSNRLQLWAPKQLLGRTCMVWVRGIESTRESPTLAGLGEMERVGTSPSASPNWMCNFQA